MSPGLRGRKVQLGPAPVSPDRLDRRGSRATPAPRVTPGPWGRPVHRAAPACKASVDMFRLTKDDFIPQLEDVITVGEFYALAAGGQIIFT